VSEIRRIPLGTGVTLNVASAGDPTNPAVILLHGFPESHRTWREIVPRLQDEFYLVMPDQRGFAGSDLPQDVDDYKADALIDDIFALADTLGIESFTLVGHDWGGAISWAAALRGDPRLRRLAIVNAPHPVIFQKSLIESPEQRAASQYINAFRNPMMEKGIEAMGLETFFSKTFASHADISLLSDEERQAYLDDWGAPGAMTAMLNWYRASEIVVPQIGEEATAPAWTKAPFPRIVVPTLVLWAMRDTALLPSQLGGLYDLVENLRIVTIPDAGHFVPWEQPKTVAAGIRDFIYAESD